MDIQVSEVRFSKMKMLKYTIVALIILLMGVDMFVDSRSEQGFMHYFGQTFGIFSIIFFGSAFVICFILLLRTKQGLVFTEQGLRDYSCFGVGNFIKWEEVVGIERYEIYRHKYIKISIKNPEGFVAESSGIARYMYRLTHKVYGTPLFISPLLLKSNFDELFTQVQLQWNASK